MYKTRDGYRHGPYTKARAKEVMDLIKKGNKMEGKKWHAIVAHGAKDDWYVYEYDRVKNQTFKDFTPLTQNDIDRMIDKTPKFEDQVFIYTLAYSGRRVSEVCGKWGIRPMDIDDRENVIRFFIEKKGGEKRSQKDRKRIVVPKKVIVQLRRYLYRKEQANDPIEDTFPIFPKKRGWAWKLISEAGNKIDLKVWPHLFRHSYAARLAKSASNPSDITKIQEQMQHSDPKITYDYIREFNKKATKELVEKTFAESESK